MRCPSCGAVHSSEQCPQFTAAAASVLAISEADFCADQTNLDDFTSDALADVEVPAFETSPRSRLLEFPGVARRPVPKWRKELSERVREVQERRAREAVLEAEEAEPQNGEHPGPSQPQLELLPKVDAPPLNPLVASAL